MHLLKLHQFEFCVQIYIAILVIILYYYVILFHLKYRAVSQAAGKTFSVEEDGNNAQ